MTGPSCPAPGTLVTYLNPDSFDTAVFVQGLVVGDHVVDPDTARAWVPVSRPGHSMSVVDTATIIEAQPRRVR